MNRGKFITLEGVEGVGKSTNLSYLTDYLAAANIPFVVTREPGGTPLAEEIRAMVLAPRDEPVAPLAELLMVFAARAQHIEQFIVPHLDAGTWVVSDRFTDATYAYQGCGRGIDTAAILELERLVQGAMQPDLTLYLDCPPEIGMARADARAALDRIETAGMDFMNRVRAGYLARISQYPQRFVTIDASVALPQVKAQLIAALDARIGSLL
jgi:dTMP kinase